MLEECETKVKSRLKKGQMGALTDEETQEEDSARMVSLWCLQGLLVFVLHFCNGMEEPSSGVIPPLR